MVDILYHNQQNQDFQSEIEIEIPKFRCKVHRTSQVQLINLNTYSNTPLVCVECVLYDKLKPDQLVLIKEIFAEKKGKIIRNWPPQLDEELQLQFNHSDVQESSQDRLLKQVNEYFDEFKKKILQSINDHQKKVVAHINRMEEERQNVIGKYIEISKKEEIKKQILKNKNNVNELEEYLRNTIQEKQNQSKNDKLILQDSLNNLNKCQQKLKIDFIMNQFELVLEKFKSIDILNPPIVSSIPLKDVNIILQNTATVIKQKEYPKIQKDSQFIIVKEKLNLNSFENLSQYANYENIFINLENKNMTYQNMLTLSEGLRDLTQLTHLSLYLWQNNINM